MILQIKPRTVSVTANPSPYDRDPKASARPDRYGASGYGDEERYSQSAWTR